jgi:hypothetical protein
MNDPLQEYLKKHRPPVPPAPVDEWSRILARTRMEAKSKKQRLWYYVSAATLSAAGWMAFVNFAPRASEPEFRWEQEDMIFQVETVEQGAYQDWLWMTDQLVAAAED